MAGIFRKQRDRRQDAVAVRFEAVGLRYGGGPEIFTDIDFSLPSGSFHFLTGASGAGKSSLLSLLYLAQRPTRGSITLFGQEVTSVHRQELPAVRRRIGVVFQDFRLLDHLSALDNVALPLRVAGVSEEEIRRHVPELLAWVGLREQMNARPPTLSGGQKQRIAIARAVISRPDLLLADEPTGNVDDRIATRLLHLFIELNKLGTTVLIATHSEGLIQRFRFPRLHLDGGGLAIVDPITEEVRALVGADSTPLGREPRP
ncbi:cell division ATP-binding protein FtsE [Rhodospirillum rubrum]|uniref:cell division ATP-binding protein FtsE n=1 Tax=Rhodospirillum rubrum TaxID=1085 RepID=UPI001ED3D31E|nr:cell division ATP-binding protein FtsE [Rhodospirillum rubrum]MBK1665547.1 cell division ATP-binding protein FtsE [Rhodospirillum rubrum]MBK1678373.1 cell division ATP-binding protein FtsE [Rhodospirillum rubrum]